MQPASSTTSRRILTVSRRPARRPHISQRHPVSTRDIEASASTASGEQDLRARMADAFIALGSGVDAASAQAQANAFYRSSRQDWARALDSIPALGFRSEIATAFRTLGTGVVETTSQERTVAFYRGSGQGWAANLG